MGNMGNGVKLGFMLLIGFLLIEIGLNGKLGSILGAILTPDAMQATGNGSSNNGSASGSGTLSARQIASFAKSVGLSGQALIMSVAIALAESGGVTSAHNPGNGTTDSEDSYGLWQINILAHPEYSASRLSDPGYNAQAMFAISGSGTNWTPWGTYTSGRYLSYMAQAQQAVN